MRIDWSNVPVMTPVRVKARSRNLNGVNAPFLGTPYPTALLRDMRMTRDKDTTMLFVRQLECGDVVCFGQMGSESGVWVFADHAISLYSIEDRIKYKIPSQETDTPPTDIKQVARSIADSAKRGHDREKYDQDTDRVLNDSRNALLSVEDVARAYLDGKTVLYRPVGSGAGEWIVARGTHNIEFDKYEYRVAAKQPSGSMQYSPYTDTEEHTADTHRGLYRKYHIAKADGSPTDPNADYFVLRLDEENPWGHACREAVLCLARNLRDEFPQLTHDLITRYGGKAADTMVIRGPARDAHFDELEVSIARGRIKAGECDKEVSERYEKIWIEDDRVTPLNLCIAEQVIQKGFCDNAVTSRYDRLRREGKILSYAEGCDKTEPEFRKEPFDEEPVMKIREPLSPMSVDEAIVRRFNELVREGKIEYCPGTTEWDVVRLSQYRLLPTPRYRPFTAVEAAGHLGKKLSLSDKRTGLIEWHISSAGVYFPNDGFFTWEEMAVRAKFTDTGEPFGVKL